jgi:crotonobetainyl-CoA:carnitine CoA-transferase CaiB-like acyl-CoA transferase
VQGGEVMIAAGNDGLFARLCSALDLPELTADERFATNPDRVAHRAELAALLQDRLRDEPFAELLERLEAAGVPGTPVNDVGDAADHEQTKALGMIQPIPEPTVALPLTIDGERVSHRRRPPRLGEHTDEILRDLGYDEEELATLSAEGVIRRVESSS